MPFLEINGARLYYQVDGQGTPIVFSHGASWDHRQWRPQVEALAQDLQVVVWDIRGHGRSTLPPGPVDPKAFSQDLIALLDHLELPRAVLCGLSMGGHISLQTAAWHPDRVAALILIGTPFTNSYNWYERLAKPINRLSQRLMPMPLIARWQAQAMARHEPTIGQYAEQATLQLTHDRWVRLWDAISRMESRDNLSKIRCPTLILEGDGDWMTHRQQAAMATQIVGSQHQIITDAGHATNLENPLAVNQAIAEFLHAQGIGRSQS
jgi:3-oxoadipate enol-lactonase